jgi:hypothetical protein
MVTIGPKSHTGDDSRDWADFPAVMEGFLRTVLQEDEANPAALSRTQPFMEMGLGSMEILDLRALLSDYLGRPLDSAFLFRHGTIASVAAALSAEVRSEGAAAPQSAVQAPAAQVAVDQPSSHSECDAALGLHDDADIAVIGIACNFPGGGPEGFWRLLRDGVDGVRQVPTERWWWPESNSAEQRFESGGYIDRVDAFDAHFFRISPAEAQLIDPQQRMLLELAWELFEDAGHQPREWRGSSTGVWMLSFRLS